MLGGERKSIYHTVGMNGWRFIKWMKWNGMILDGCLESLETGGKWCESRKIRFKLQPLIVSRNA